MEVTAPVNLVGRSRIEALTDFVEKRFSFWPQQLPRASGANLHIACAPPFPYDGQLTVGSASNYVDCPTVFSGIDLGERGQLPASPDASVSQIAKPIVS